MCEEQHELKREDSKIPTIKMSAYNSKHGSSKVIAGMLLAFVIASGFFLSLTCRSFLIVFLCACFRAATIVEV